MASTLMAETSPPAIRGIITGLSILLIDAAAILATGVNYAFSTGTTDKAFRMPLSIQIVFGVVILISTLFVQDSPSFFLIKSKDDRALATLRSLRRGYDEVEVLAEFENLKAQKAIREEVGQVPWKALFQGTDLRRTLLALSIANMQQMSGIAFATNYVTVFLSTIGSSVSPFVLSMVVALLAFTGAICGLFLVDKVGRRVLALSSFCALFVINLVVGIMGFLTLSPVVSRVIAAFCCMFGFFFAVGFGPLTYVVAAEMPTARLRNRSSSFTFFTLSIFATVVAYVLPYIANKDA
jgi:MFS family permease